MGNRIRLLTMGSARQSRELVSAARLRGHEVESVHIVEEAREWTSRSTDQLRCEFRNAVVELGGRLDALVNLGRATVPGGIRAIATLSEEAVAAGAVPNTAKVIGPSARAAAVWDDKRAMVRYLASVGVPIPASIVLDVASSRRVQMASVADAGISFPLVVKVPGLTGGAGMRYAVDAEALNEAVSSLARFDSQVVVSEFVSGDEVSVDLLRLGNETLVYPPGFKRCTDPGLSHADNKIKVNGVVRSIDAFSRDVVKIAESLDLQGFFSIEGVVTRRDPPAWRVLEGATRVTNNIQIQDASIGLNSFGMVADHVAGVAWRPREEQLGLALSIPIYVHRGMESQSELRRHAWAKQVKLENLGDMPDSSDTRTRLTVKIQVDDLERQLDEIEAATGDVEVKGLVLDEVQRIRSTYGT